MADPVATELAAIRRRAEQITGEHDADSCDLNGETCTGHDAERLLGAVEAVLALHQPGPFVVLGALCKEHEVYRHFSITSVEAERASACPECAAVICVSCTCGAADLEHCATRSAITAELLSEEGNRG